MEQQKADRHAYILYNSTHVDIVISSIEYDANDECLRAQTRQPMHIQCMLERAATTHLDAIT